MGQAVSHLGISISTFAYPLVVLAATGSAAQAGLVGSVLAATTFFLRLPAGVVVDRWSRRRILVVCDLGRALAAGSLAAALASGHFWLAHVLAVAVVEGSLGVLFGPAEAAAVRRVVAPEQVREAVARNQTRTQLAGLLGPPLGGVLVAAGRALPFLADAVSYLVSLACVLTVRRPLQEPRPPAPRRRPLTEVLAGSRWIWRSAFLRTLLLWLAGVGVVFNSIGLVMLVAARERGASAGELGVMFGITAAGGVVGAFAAPALVRSVAPNVLVATFGWIGAAATALLVPVDSPYAIGALGAAAFLLYPALNALAFGLVAAEAPDELQGRVTSSALQITSVGAPIGPLLAGVVLGLAGATAAIVGYAGALLALALFATASVTLRSGPEAT